MIFADYVRTLKKHFKRKISDQELCEILFDSIISPLDLKNRNNEVLTLDKAEVSRIMNGRKNIPKILQDHVYDQIVLDDLEEYFDTKIITELVPDKSDICYQLMNLIEETEDMSPSRKANLRLLANPKFVSLFLAEMFICMIRQNTDPLRQNPKSFSNVTEPILQICGITMTNGLII